MPEHLRPRRRKGLFSRNLGDVIIVWPSPALDSTDSESSEIWSSSSFFDFSFPPKPSLNLQSRYPLHIINDENQAYDSSGRAFEATRRGYEQLYSFCILFKTSLDCSLAEQSLKAFYDQLSAARYHLGVNDGEADELGIGYVKGPHYTKDCPLKEERKTLEEAYYTQFGGPFQGGGYRATTLGFYQRNNANPSYQERRQSMEDTLSKFMGESAKRHEENSNLIKEIRASTDAAIRNQGT
ncbi:hypothetical protein Tco_0530061 [Tanacetum coccineum]